MSIIYKGQQCYTIAESIAYAKAENRERAKRIPELLRQKELEYV